MKHGFDGLYRTRTDKSFAYEATALTIELRVRIMTDRVDCQILTILTNSGCIDLFASLSLGVLAYLCLD